MADGAEFQDGLWYPARVRPGAHLGESKSKGTLGVYLKLEISSGDMYGHELDAQLWITDNEQAKQNTADNLAVLGFNAFSDDWGKVGDLIAGKECEVQAQVKDYKGAMQVKGNRFRHKRTGAEKPLPQRAAELFGNVTGGVAEGTGEDPPF